MPSHCGRDPVIVAKPKCSEYGKLKKFISFLRKVFELYSATQRFKLICSFNFKKKHKENRKIINKCLKAKPKVRYILHWAGKI